MKSLYCFDFTHFRGQVKNFVCFLGNLKTPKYQPLRRQIVDKQICTRGHSTTTWTEFCHFLTPLCGQFLYPEHGQKQTFFDPLPPHLVHVVIEWPPKQKDFNNYTISVIEILQKKTYQMLTVGQKLPMTPQSLKFWSQSGASWPQNSKRQPRCSALQNGNRRCHDRIWGRRISDLRVTIFFPVIKFHEYFCTNLRIISCRYIPMQWHFPGKKSKVEAQVFRMVLILLNCIIFFQILMYNLLALLWQIVKTIYFF